VAHVMNLQAASPREQKSPHELLWISSRRPPGSRPALPRGAWLYRSLQRYGMTSDRGGGVTSTTWDEGLASP
jgi:hypothetical protein